MADDNPVRAIAEQMMEAAERDDVSVKDILDGFGRRSYGPVLFVVGLLSLSPIGSIPGASIIFGVLIILFMAQYLVHDRAPWFPSWITDRHVDAEDFRKGVSRIAPYLYWLGRLTKTRLTNLAEAPWIYVVALTVIAHGLTMFPLALVPWGVAPPSLAIAVFGLGIATRDGVMLLFGFAFSALAIAVVAAVVW